MYSYFPTDLFDFVLLTHGYCFIKSDIYHSCFINDVYKFNWQKIDNIKKHYFRYNSNNEMMRIVVLIAIFNSGKHWFFYTYLPPTSIASIFRAPNTPLKPLLYTQMCLQKLQKVYDFTWTQGEVIYQKINIWRTPPLRKNIYLVYQKCILKVTLSLKIDYFFNSQIRHSHYSYLFGH